MKRCPECGYRVKAELKRCPLCDSRMAEDPSGQTTRLQTHVHENREECLLPNRTEQEAARARYRSIMEQQLRKAGVRQEKPPMNKQVRQLIGVAVVLVVYALMNACSA